MNILFITSSIAAYRGGIQRVIETLSEYFEQHDISCYYCYSLIDDPSIPKNKKLYVSYQGNYDRFRGVFLDFVTSNKIDVIIDEGIPYINVIRALREVKDKRLARIVFCLHATPQLMNFKSPTFMGQVKDLISKILYGCNLYTWRNKQIFKVVDKYVLLSPRYEDDLCQILDVDDKTKISSIANPFKLRHETHEYKKGKENLFLIVARLADSQKNLCSALRIWKLFSQVNLDYKLEIAGYGPDEDMYKEYAKKLNLERVKFVGKTDKPQEYYKRAKFFLMTSRYEGFPMTIIEAMEYDCIPIVFSTFDAIYDVIESGENGFLIQPYDEQNFCDKMLELVNNPKEYEAIVNNIEPSLQSYDVSVIGQKWTEFLNQWKSW